MRNHIVEVGKVRCAQIVCLVRWILIGLLRHAIGLKLLTPTTHKFVTSTLVNWRLCDWRRLAVTPRLALGNEAWFIDKILDSIPLCVHARHHWVFNRAIAATQLVYKLRGLVSFTRSRAWAWTDRPIRRFCSAVFLSRDILHKVGFCRHASPLLNRYERSVDESLFVHHLNQSN